MKNKLLFLASAVLLSATLSACGSSSSSGSSTVNYKQEVTNDGKAIDGGTLNYAVVASSSSTGMLLDELVSSNVDDKFSSLVDESMFGYDGDRLLDDSGLASATFDTEANTVTVKLTGEDYKWSDGQPFTIDDYIFTIKAMADEGYEGVRFGDGYKNIAGMADYQAGTADDVSGIQKVDDYTVVLSYPDGLTPSMKYAGGDVPAFVMPEHIFKDIPVSDWASSDYSRTGKFVGMGPFVISDITTGESIYYKPNPNYYKGAPSVNVKMDIVSPDTIVSEMKAGNYDIAQMPTDDLESYQDLDNINLLGTIDSAYEYISFNLGTYDEETGQNVMNADAKMNDVSLRKAIGYAIDNKTAGESLYNGLYKPANSLIVSFFGDLHDSDIKGYTYDPDKANELLDKAGYKDVDGDGIREDKNGDPLKISLAARTRTSANETLIQQYIDWWKEVGLDVELYTGRTLESNTFYNEVQANNKDIDMYIGGWSTGFDPNPSDLWGPEAQYNFSRFVSDENTQLLDALSSEESFDEETNLKNYKAWQEYVYEQAFAIPTFEDEQLTAVNKRVKYFDLYYGSDSKSQWQNVQLTAKKGVATD